MSTPFFLRKITLLLLFSAASYGFAQSAQNEKLNLVLKQYETVIQSIPHHPLSMQALEAAIKVFQSPDSNDEESALRNIMRALPNSRLGIYALEKLLHGTKEPEKVCSELVQSYPDHAIGTFALNYILERSEDPIRLGEEIAAAYPDKRLGAFVFMKLGDHASANGKFAQAENFYFNAGRRALPGLLELWKAHDRWLQLLFFPNAPGWPLPPVQPELFAFAKTISPTATVTGHPENESFNEAFWDVDLNAKKLEHFMRDKGAYPWQWQVYATLLLSKKHIKEGRVLVAAMSLEYLHGLMPDTTQPNMEFILPCIGAYMFTAPEKFEVEAFGHFSASLEGVMEVARLDKIQGELLELAMRSLPLAPASVQAHFLHLIAMRQAVTIDPLLAASTLEKIALIPGIDAAIIAASNAQIEKLRSGEWKNALSGKQ